MTNTKHSSLKRKAAAASPRLHVFFSRVLDIEQTIGSNSTRCALVWNRKRDRKQTIVLVGLLEQSSNNDEKLKEYRDRLDRLKLRERQTGCARRLADDLEIVEIQHGGQQDHVDYPWWLQLFGQQKTNDTDQYQYQWLKFGLDSKGRKQNYQFPTSNVQSDTEWSLLLDVLNHCDSIEEIIQTGNLPDAVKLEPAKSNSATASHDHQVETKDSEESPSFFVPQSMTILHLQNLRSLNLSSIAMVRCAQAFSSLWNNTIPTNETKQQFLPSPIDLSKERISRWNAFLSAMVDMLLGFCVGAILVYLLLHPERLENTIHFNLAWKQTAFQFLQDKIAWLETFPAGFKLNEQLTHTMGRGIRSLLNSHRGILLATLWNPEVFRHYLIPSLAVLSALSGWTTFLASVVDLWRLEILHATLLQVCFRKLYQMELFLLSALFRLFRGKKRNLLRQRTDSMKYDAMQLLVGTIAFCVCVFLWTTVMVYYSFFLICNLTMHLPLMGISILYCASRSFPFGALLFRFAKPHWFPKDLYLKNEDSNASGMIQVGELVPILESPASILAGPIGGNLKGLFKWFLVSFLEIVYPRSSHHAHSFLPPTLLVDDKAKA